MADRIVTMEQLEADGLTLAEVRRACPLATEYRTPDGVTYWLREDLVSLYPLAPDSDL